MGRADTHKNLKKKMQVEPRLSWDALTLKGVGLASPRKQFELYTRMHAYLASAQVDGVKVDVQVLIYTSSVRPHVRVAEGLVHY